MRWLRVNDNSIKIHAKELLAQRELTQRCFKLTAAHSSVWLAFASRWPARPDGAFQPSAIVLHTPSTDAHLHTRAYTCSKNTHTDKTLTIRAEVDQMYKSQRISESVLKQNTRSETNTSIVLYSFSAKSRAYRGDGGAYRPVNTNTPKKKTKKRQVIGSRPHLGHRVRKKESLQTVGINNSLSAF